MQEAHRAAALRAGARSRTLAGGSERALRAATPLSHACHHQPYDLPPTAGELEDWLETVREFVNLTEGSRQGA